MALFGLMRDKCTYCRTPLDKGREVVADVRVPGMVGTFKRKFCSGDHADAYEKELRNRPKRSGGGCCG